MGRWILVLAVAGSVRAGFQQGPTDIAGEGMGGASTARAGGAAALFINPAGPALLPRAEAAFAYGSLYAGLPGVSNTQGTLAVACPLRARWTLAGGASNFDADGLLQEQEVLVGGSYRATPIFSVGANLAYLRHSYDTGQDPAAQADPTFSAGTSKGAMGVDAGALATLPRLSLGVSGRHLNMPDVGISERDPVPMELRAGAAGNVSKTVLVAADILWRNAGNVADGRRTTWGGGVEWRAAPILALRAGLGTGKVTAGVGFKIKDYGVDYAFGLVTSFGDNAGTHRLAFNYRFGPMRTVPAAAAGLETVPPGAGAPEGKTGSAGAAAGRMEPAPRTQTAPLEKP